MLFLSEVTKLTEFFAVLKKMTFSNSLYFYLKPVLGLVILLCLLTLSVYASAAETKSSAPKKKKIQKTTDLRVIVDISGSMKKTDPNNLRRPALRLLAGLIPEGSRSGVWNFGKQVNMSVKIGPVNEAWRSTAREQSKKISSVGLFTNIESAMRKASFDWKKPDPRFNRHLILLTDGHVDVSEDDKKDKASRKKILQEILPALEKAKVRVHTIALSDGVDDSLLSTLSSYTDGLYKKVNNADDLQKLFLQMLEQSVKLDTLPLKDNQFNVDASVKDMTLLVFNKSAEATKIITPDNKRWSEKSNSGKVKWFRDEGYDLVTIKEPSQGEWKIIAPEDKNNRVVVATNLKLKVNDLPGYLMFGDVLKITAHLQEDGKVLGDHKLLSKFDFSILRKIDDAGERQYEMSRPEKNNNISEYQLPPILKKGVNELVIKAKSPTVEREVRHQFKVYETPAETLISEKDGEYEIKVTPYLNLLRLDSVKIEVELNDKTTLELIRTNDDWSVNVSSKYQETPFTLTINALRADGKEISLSFNKVLSAQGGTSKLKLTDENKLKDYSLAKKNDISAENELANKDKNKKAKEDEEAEEKLPNRIETRKKETDMSWPMIIGLVAIGNVILIIIFGGGYLFLKKRKAKMTKDINDQIGELDSGESVDDDSELKE